MTAATKGRVGRITLIVLAVVSLGYPLVSKALPACPLGADPHYTADTVCSSTFGGLWRSEVIGIGSGGISVLVALGLALTARRFGGWVDEAVSKASDLFFAIPDVLVLILVELCFQLVAEAHGIHPRGALAENLMPLAVMTASLAAVGWAAPTRMIRNRLRSLEGQDFVAAAEAVGATRGRILVKHLLPFAGDFVLAIFLLRVPAAILAESTVSFLGLGMPPDQPSLGTYLGQNWQSIVYGEARVIVPAWILLVAIVIAFQWTAKAALEAAEGP